MQDNNLMNQYDNGQPIYIGQYINGKSHGLWKWFYENGNLMCKGTYNMDEPTSLWIIYNIDETQNQTTFYAR